MVNKGLNLVLAIIIALAIGMIVGTIQGYWIAYKGIPNILVISGIVIAIYIYNE